MLMQFVVNLNFKTFSKGKNSVKLFLFLSKRVHPQRPIRITISCSNKPQMDFSISTYQISELSTNNLYKGIHEDLSWKGDKEFSCRVVMFELRSSLENERLPPNPPPPKLHYSTFWRSLTRKFFWKRHEEMKLAAQNHARQFVLNGN